MPTILIVDDEKNIRTHLASVVERAGYRALVAADGTDALRRLEREAVDLVLSDVRMPGLDGMTLLRELRSRRPEALVILMTAFATVAGAVEAMREGAHDYLVKPFSMDEVEVVIARALEVQGLRRENRSLRRAVDPPALLESANPAMRRVLETALQAAASDATVLLGGESGTGKNVLARAIHDWSPRRTRPFVVIACTTLADHLLESELFGHVRGAFTGAWKDKPGRLERAQGGTVFLDEVGELPPELQAKLLRFLEERQFERVGGADTIEVDARVVAATNRDLEAEVHAGRFREDLFFRLNVIGLRLPPLRERPEDLPALVDHLLGTLRVRHARPDVALAPAAREALLASRWPGNVRELVNVLERALVLCRGDAVQVEDLPDHVTRPGPPPPTGGTSSLEDMERRHVQTVLAESATLEEAAARLGINVTTLWRKRKRWNLD
ncbi:MAG TPA: sigma-54 dependent transcriptional regulator [Candidatus Eisenbacteria bacterium]|nr:sigma-54 dependent transcriptional regulator [Candidatus Eisenbacteria bacterium]